MYQMRGSNGIANDSGNVYIAYNSWEMAALAKWSEEYKEKFAPETLALPFSSIAAYSQFIEEYRQGDWLLLDTVYSLKGIEPELEIPMSLLEGASVSYLIKEASSDSYRIVAFSVGGEKFEFDLVAETDKRLNSTLSQFDEAEKKEEALCPPDDLASDSGLSVAAEEVTSPSALMIDDSLVSEQGLEVVPVEEVPLVESDVSKTFSGAAVNIVTGESLISVIDISVQSSMRLMRAAASGSIAESEIADDAASTPIGKLSRNNFYFFPVTFYDYEETAGNDTTQVSRHVYPNNIDSYNFNTPEVLAIKSYNDYYYRGNLVSSYLLFNPIYMPKYPNVINLGDQNVRLIPIYDTDSSYGGGITQGIAKQTLPSNGFQVNFRTMNNLQLFPAINDPSKQEIFIYANDTSGDILGTQASTGLQYAELLGPSEQTPMISAYADYKMPFRKGTGALEGFYVYDSDVDQVHIDKAKVNKEMNYQTIKQNETKGLFPFNGSNSENNKKYNFGMTMDLNFALPVEITENPIVFEFTGDDDLWVYLDNELILDMGGLHKKALGQINFTDKSTRIVNDADEYYKRNITKIDENGITQDLGSPVITSSFDIDQSIQIHNLKIFYMERSPTDSNCKIQFNMPMYITLSKETYPEYLTKDFQFTYEYARDKGNISSSDITNADITCVPIPDIKSGESVNLPLPINFKIGDIIWIRLTEQSSRGFPSTIYRGSILDETIVCNNTSLTTGWFKYMYGTAEQITCLNYTPDPIKLVKYDYNHPTRTIPNIKFNLYVKDSSSDYTPVTYNSGSVVVLNTTDTYLSFGSNPYLKPNSKYKLVEVRNAESAIYMPQEPIYFETTGSLSPKIKCVTQDEAAKNITYPVDSGASLYQLEYTGLYAYATEDGKELRIFNKLKSASITVKKTIDEDGYLVQGNPIFTFKLERLKTASNGSEVVEEVRYKTIEFTDSTKKTLTCVFDNLIPLRKYRVTELTTMRYKQQETPDAFILGNLTDDESEICNFNPTVSFNNTRFIKLI
ncbi:MAG: fibro-slime domain-containing protein [Clostridiales bacterium]|nr:fibro-slime domain-containing protein [Clostridiales bacterium]